MGARHVVEICILALLLVSCTLVVPPTPTPTSTPVPASPTPTLTPSPTATPMPTPTPTPIPPQQLAIRWPAEVSAMEPVPVEVEVLPPPGISVTTTLSAFVRDPGGARYWESVLLQREGNLFTAPEPLRLPLMPQEGDWRLTVLVESNLEVRGERVLYFEPAPVPFYDLRGDSTVHTGFDLLVPQAFQQTATMGDAWAGGRVWRYQDGELSLFWAPGPVEPLSLNTAVVMLEATYDPEALPSLTDVQDAEWHGQVGFLFQERWPELGGGPGESLLVQGPDYWLYVLRLRALGQSDIPALQRQVRETFAFVEQ